MLKSNAIKFLFMDNRPYEYIKGFNRLLGQPKKYNKNPIITPELPHEFKRVHYYGTALFDNNDKLFKTWYSTHYYAPGISEADKGKAYAYLNYSYSHDGLNWTKPELDVVKGTNIVMDNDRGTHGPSVILDDFETDPEKRFKLAMAPYINKCGITIYTSPDGIHWNPVNEGKAVIDVNSDCHIGFYRDPNTRHYRVSLRTRIPDRRVWISESVDLMNWSRPVLAIEPGPGDPCGTQFYGMQMTPYGSFIMGWLSMYNTFDFNVDPNYNKMAGTMDVQLAYSRDGFGWHRLFQGDKFIPYGSPDDWDAQCVMPSSAAIYRPDGIYFYFSGSAYDHSGPTKIPYSKIGKECIGMARLRPDGFVELEAREDVCELMSRPFMVRSGELYINASVCPTGYVLAEVSDTKGDPIEGFSFSDCVPCKGDNTACRITWNGSPNLSHIEEKIIRLKIRAKKATLYSMFFPNGNNLADYWKFREISCLNPKFDLEDF
jgi:hypothetical protein